VFATPDDPDAELDVRPVVVSESVLVGPAVVPSSPVVVWPCVVGVEAVPPVALAVGRPLAEVPEPDAELEADATVGVCVFEAELGYPPSSVAVPVVLPALSEAPTNPVQPQSKPANAAAEERTERCSKTMR